MTPAKVEEALVLAEKLESYIDYGNLPSENQTLAGASAAIRELTSALAEMEWRPIESAPRDGTHILGLFDQIGVVECWFGREEPILEPEWIAVALPSHGCGCCACVNPEPTHWQPLPEPPHDR